ncbi:MULTISPECIES: substrate-binding domain-containing protein [Pseudomonas]|uniref:Substrate-binding domain-containing protein n=1 Tax=Pseudomonas sessilinigenes TaxID=658629 RepID=A0ABX8MLM0_9PSED|nr:MULTISPECIES: substrate-binding domain-containing protein [Pseudomonas]AZC26919.1 Phosphate-binding DING protein [Pseudomonas sessilinigenes]QIH07715.1 protein disulfide reductase [Pseudomonas sp. BIOMIG1BAC]QXH39114.1 substrate-binding domain-containing protein [Pseudomonas sessilinigenes]
MPKHQGWIASMLFAALCMQQAQADINGGGSTLPAKLYQTPGVLTAGFAPYLGMDRGRDKAAFLRNDYSLLSSLPSDRNVHWAASESKLKYSEVGDYFSAHHADWGPLIQVPSAATTIAIRFNKAGSAEVDLSTNDLCGIFSGRVNDWRQIKESGRTGPITVIYPNIASGSTELFTRFLNAKCVETGTFAVTTDFASSYSGGLPAGARSANSSEAIMEELYVLDGRITFIGPTYAAATLEGLSDATKVARVNGVSPTPANISDAIATVPVPAVAERRDQNLWVPVFTSQANIDANPGDKSLRPYPASGYPILGFTNMLFSQCYADATQTSQIRSFFYRHYGALVSNDAAIRDNRLARLPAAWKTAVRDAFLTPTSPLSIGNANVCNGIGRPL